MSISKKGTHELNKLSSEDGISLLLYDVFVFYTTHATAQTDIRYCIKDRGYITKQGTSHFGDEGGMAGFCRKGSHVLSS